MGPNVEIDWCEVHGINGAIIDPKPSTIIRISRPRDVAQCPFITRRIRALITLVLVAAGLPLCTSFVPSAVAISERRCVQLSAKSGTKKKKPSGKTLSVNRVALRNYEVLEKLEAGIALLGTEVKSIRDGKLNLRDGYVKPSKNGRSCVLHNVHIGKHTMAGAFFQHEERRPRPLLIHKQEARKWMQQTEQKGMTIVPLKAYLSEKNQVKIQIALCRGKNVRDKRADIMERDAKREDNRIFKSFRVGI